MKKIFSLLIPLLLLASVSYAQFAPGPVSNTAYSSAWNGKTTTAPSQNAVYDIIVTLASAAPAATQSVACNGGTLTLTPTANLMINNVVVTCPELANDCVVTMGETGSTTGQIAVIRVSSSNMRGATFTTSSGVLVLSKSPFTVNSGNEALLLQYDGTRWVEIARADATDYAAYATTIPLVAGGGTVDAITADYTPNVTLADKVTVAVRSAGANTSTTPSFAPDGLTSRTIVKHGGQALVAGDIGAAGMIALLQYDLANTRWELLNPVYPAGYADKIGLSGTMTDEQLLCGENTDGTTKAKSCGAKVTDNSTDDHILAKISGAVENATIVKTIYLPVAYFEDGAAPPAAAAVLASTRKVKIRDFDGASNENLEVSFTAPIDYSSGLKFRFIGYVSNATAPAENEVVAFSFAACSNGNSDALGCSAGTAQTSSLTAAAGYAQYDRLAGAWSNAITVTDIAAGETVQGILIRLAESTDTYAKDFALAGIEIKYVATFIMGSAY